MEKIQNEIAEILVRELGKYFGPSSVAKIQYESKPDRSMVTKIDYLVSNEFKIKLSQHLQYNRYSFFSEEDHSHLEFPAIVLDPIDGTRELIAGIPECAVSLAIMHSSEINDPLNYGWIYNPFTAFSLDGHTKITDSINQENNTLMGYVSRTEWKKGLYENYKNNKIVLEPKGSIAFKLALLATNECDFVVTLAPKNIWDIAAGTVLLAQRGVSFYCENNKISSLDRVKYGDKLLWCHDSKASELLKHFHF